jgi:hypothetical protein
MGKNVMNKNFKPVLGVLTGIVATAALGGATAKAALTPGGTGITGTSTLTTKSSTSSDEQLTIDWTVVESATDIYTYNYVVKNPAKDVLLPPSPPGISETVDSLYVDFDVNSTSVLTGPTGGIGVGGSFFDIALQWSFLDPSIGAGGTSGNLTFTSMLAPSPGEASASDANPPSPWDTANPGGSPVPVPGTGNFGVPDSASTMTLLGGVMMLLPFGRRFLGRK